MAMSAFRAPQRGFYGTNRTVADLGCFLIGKSARANENERLALFVRQCRPRGIGRFRSPCLIPVVVGDAFYLLRPKAFAARRGAGPNRTGFSGW
jgi:hypothetical protein